MIQAIDRALDILEHLAQRPDQPVAASDIAALLGINRTTCSNLLKTLAARGYVQQPVARGGYLLGPMAYQLARGGGLRLDIVAVAEPLMLELAREVPEHFVLARLHQGRLLILCDVEGNGELQVRRDIVEALDPYKTVNGRMLLAYLPSVELEAFVAQRGLPEGVWPEVTNFEELKAALALMRETQGYEDVPRQLARASYPIFQDGQMVAALGMFAPGFRFVGDYRTLGLRRLRETAEKISAGISRG